jgi:hypothetical protein
MDAGLPAMTVYLRAVRLQEDRYRRQARSYIKAVPQFFEI